MITILFNDVIMGLSPAEPEKLGAGTMTGADPSVPLHAGCTPGRRNFFFSLCIKKYIREALGEPRINPSYGVSANHVSHMIRVHAYKADYPCAYSSGHTFLFHPAY